MNEPVKLFVVEGEARECRFIHEMAKSFFQNGKYRSRVIKLPAEQNIYMLYQLLKQDDFETDIVEVLRDHVSSAKEILHGVSRQDIDEVFLFFDYDLHQDNLPHHAGGEEDIILKMLKVFDNETENGKLFISYQTRRKTPPFKAGDIRRL